MGVIAQEPAGEAHPPNITGSAALAVFAV